MTDVTINAPVAEITLSANAPRKQGFCTYENVAKLHAGRGLIDDCMKKKKDLENSPDRLHKHEVAVKWRDKKLQELGFSGVNGFLEFNEKMCLEALKEYLPFVQTCDKCSGVEGTPPCVSTCGENSYFHHWKDGNDIYPYLLNMVRELWKGMDSEYKVEESNRGETARAMNEAMMDKTFQIGNCPQGHGFVVQYKGQIPFSLLWRIE
jgi:hypothetical protein